MALNEGFLYGTNEVVIQCVLLALMLIAVEIGFRLGRKAEANTRPETKAQIAIVEGALLGVLALLLGFTMSMAASRFETRKQLVLDEANAIRTAYLRAQLLPAPEGSEITGLLRRYIEVRARYGTSGDDFGSLSDLHAQTEHVQMEVWTRATAYAQKDPNEVTVGFMLQSLNEAFDLETARWTAIHNQVPPNVIYVNGLVALLATMLVGYAFGLDGRRNLFSTCVLVLAISMVLAVIVDLDRPRSGFIRANQQPMMDLLHQP
jgi:hypothetical protein